MEKTYDLAVIGAGPAGYEAAIRAAQLGLSVAVVESRQAGGTCLNRGCIPTKAILHSAGLYREAKRFSEFGLAAEGLSFDYGAVARRKDKVVEQLRAGVEQLLKANGIAVFAGRGTVQGSGSVLVEGPDGTAELKTEKILIATGCVPSVPPIPGSDLPGVFTSDGLLASETAYRRLVVIGGGVIGVEFATAFADFGCEVTVLEALPRLLSNMDRELSQNLAMILKKRGVSVHTGALVERIAEGSPLVCAYTEKGEAKTVEADGILIATGRRPDTAGVFAPGVEVRTAKGFLVTDGNHETSLSCVFAVGDVTGGIQLAHAASAQGIEAAEYLAKGKPPLRPRTIPSCVYTSPEIACAGLTADEAKAEGIEVTVGKALTASLGKTVIEGGERGFVKLVFDAQSVAILGAQLMCERATDLIAGLVQAIDRGMTAEQLAAVVRPHPTFSEAVTEAAEDALGGAIHAMPRRKPNP